MQFQAESFTSLGATSRLDIYLDRPFMSPIIPNAKSRFPPRIERNCCKSCCLRQLRRHPDLAFEIRLCRSGGVLAFHAPVRIADRHERGGLQGVLDARYRVATPRHGSGTLQPARHEGHPDQRADLEASLEDLRNQTWIKLPVGCQVEALELSTRPGPVGFRGRCRYRR